MDGQETLEQTVERALGVARNMTGASIPKAGKPAPRRGESPRKGATIERSATASLRKRLGDAVRRDPGKHGDIYSRRIAEGTGLEKRVVRHELEDMVAKGLLVKHQELKGGRDYTNIYPPTYRLFGQVLTVRQIAASPHNRHQLAYNTVRERLLAGLEPEEALSLPPTTKGKIRAKIHHPAAVAASGADDW